MAAEVPTKEPIQARAGDSWKWTRALADYSYADGWRLAYYVAGPQRFEISTAADTDGKGFSVNYTAAQTTILQPGDYWIEGAVTYNSETFTVYAAAFRVLPNFSNPEQVPEGYDGRSHSRKALQAIESMIEGRAGAPEKSFEIAGQRRVDMLTPEELIRFRDYYASRVANEDRQAAADRGESTSIKIRFRSPR